MTLSMMTPNCMPPLSVAWKYLKIMHAANTTCCMTPTLFSVLQAAHHTAQIYFYETTKIATGTVCHYSLKIKLGVFMKLTTEWPSWQWLWQRVQHGIISHAMTLSMLTPKLHASTFSGMKIMHAADTTCCMTPTLFVVSAADCMLHDPNLCLWNHKNCYRSNMALQSLG
jgi:hypothetical protein